MKKILLVLTASLSFALFSCTGAVQPAFASNVPHVLKHGRHKIKFVKHHHKLKHHVVKHTKRKVK